MEYETRGLVMPAFEKDGATYPPIYEGCDNCMYSEGAITGFDFVGEEIQFVCDCLKKHVEADGHCKNYFLIPQKLSDEAEDEYNRLEELGQLPNSQDECLSQEDIDKFQSLR